VDIPAVLTDGLSGIVSVRRAGETTVEQTFGFADRAHRIPHTPATRYAIASGTKAFTAVVVGSLIVDGAMSLSTTAREILGTDLPLIADDVTVEHLLVHTSGIGDYVDEDLDEPVSLTVPVQQLDSTAAYLPALDGFPAKFAAGQRFSYCNSGYVVLALIAERVSGMPFDQLIADRVTNPAGMSATGFIRSDSLPGTAAIGYLDDGRTNVFSLPVWGSGDGGAYSTMTDLQAFWDALVGNRLLPAEWMSRLVTPVRVPPGRRFGYGMGLWADDRTIVIDGGDLGVAVRSVLMRNSGDCVTVLCNAECRVVAVVDHLLSVLTS
jgi:CubicO group peptidase (beta-lactamase class C family)